MSVSEMEQENSTTTYSGLDVFGGNSYEKELQLLKEAGADVEKLKAMKFNALQLAEIRKGIVDKVDVSKYLDRSLSWSAMEEIRLEMFQGIDMSKYRAAGFDVLQLSQIRQGIASQLDVSAYAKKEYFADQMRELRLGLSSNGKVPIIFYQDPAFDALQMREIRKGLEAEIDVSLYAKVNIPSLKMRAVRRSAQDGLVFDENTINRFNAGVLNELHNAYVDKVDIRKYIAARYDEDQLEQVRIALKNGIPIDQYITGDMRGDAMKEIRLGLEAGLDVKKYANVAFGWQQMHEMRLGLEHQIDITPYCNAYYRATQMRQIRLGLEMGLDVSRYSSLMYTAKDMRRIREQLLVTQFENGGDKTAAADVVPTKATMLSTEDAFVNDMIVHRDTYIAFEDNNMKCFLSLPQRMDGKKYTQEILEKFLDKMKVKFGLDKDTLTVLAQSDKPVIRALVAEGREVVHGTNGYYEYFFDTERNEEPEIMKDGTADLSNITKIQQVRVGDRIALYHKATKGSDGFDVYGNLVKAIPGKEIPVLKGTGFMIMNDRVSYVATYSGAIGMVEGKVEIKKLMVLEEVKITDKKIKYDGTLFVAGDINSGSDLEVTGDVIIGGHMESSIIVAGGNVIIKGGVTCPIKGGVRAEGDVSAKYFEGAEIAGNNVSANYFINCKVEAKGLVKTYGRAGMIYGGTVNSLYGIETASVGNKTGAKTIISLGVNSALLQKFNNTKKGLERELEQLETLEKEKERLKEVGAGDMKMMQWKVKINAAVASKEIRIKELKESLGKMEAEMGRGNRAEASISEIAYANTIFVICGVIFKLDQDMKTYDKLTVKLDANRENVILE